MNTKKEKSMKASFSSDNKSVYSIEASNLLSVMGKKSIIANLKSKFNLNTPTKQLISISGSGDYREDKSLKMDTTMSIYRLMRRPASLKGTILYSCNLYLNGNGHLFGMLRGKQTLSLKYTELH